jgi:hypothetical protein
MVRKGKSYEHEREWRALFEQDERPEGQHEFSFDEAARIQHPGLSVPVDLDVLIDAVYVAPGKPEWFKDQVRRVAKTYKLDKPIEISDLEARPNLT